MLADDPGCIAGETVIKIFRTGITRSITLRSLYQRFNGLPSEHRNRHGTTTYRLSRWNRDVPTYCKSLGTDGILRRNRIQSVLYRGQKIVLRLKLKSGKILRLTSDHELLRHPNSWIWTPAGQLRPGDAVLVNGRPQCKRCGGFKNVTTDIYRTFPGFCRECIYKHLRAKPNWKGGRQIDADGYVMVLAPEHPRARTNGYFYEHILIMEQHLGRYVLWPKEVVHHKNGIKQDNRIENLQLLTQAEHHREHNRFLHMDGGRAGTGGKIIFTPRVDYVASIDEDGEADVYDIVMDDPHRNFVANGIIVHNCGKTIQSIAAAEMVNARSALVVCPASVRLGWLQELEETRGHTRGWDVISYNGASSSSVRASLKDRYDVFIPDEAHFVRNLETARTQAIFGTNGGLARLATYKWPLSGTPFLNRPREGYPILKALAGDRLCAKGYDTFDRFAQRFCGAYWDGHGLNTKGATNLDELRELLRGFMLRRTKAEVLPDLPQRIITRVPIEVTVAEMAPVLAVEAEIENREAYLSPVHEDYSGLGDLAKLRHATGLAKVGAVSRFVYDLLGTVEKIVVFTWHRDVMEKLRVALMNNGIGSVAYQGGMSDRDKSFAVGQFVNDGNARVFVGQMQAAGTGINGLQKVANDVVLAELDWTPGTMSQAIDRVDRMDKKFALMPTNTYVPMLRGSLESAMLGVSDGKERVIDRLLRPAPSDDDILAGLL
jgi:SWI/SNF-related matrix-associated actin-dependent regulator 1 of chromatin subfamily A